MDQSPDLAIDRAEAAGQAMLTTDPRAIGARFDPATGRVVVELTNGCAYVFPPALAQDLQGASATDLAEIEVDGMGFNLRFPRLDVDLFVPALIAGVFGTRAWMTRELARLAGQRTSPAKAAAACANGVKGGRPRKRAAS